MRSIGWLLIFFAIMSLCMPVAAGAGENPGGHGIVRSAGSVFEAPSPQSRVVRNLNPGDPVYTIEKHGEWWIIRLTDDRVGWIEDRLLYAPQPAAAATPEPAGDETRTPLDSPAVSTDRGDGLEVAVKVRSARIREKPTSDSDLHFGLKKGDRVIVLESAQNWYRIQAMDGKTGWAHKNLFTKPDRVPPAVAGETSRPAPQATTQKQEDAAETNEVLDIRVDRSTPGTEIAVFTLGGFFPPKTFTIEDAVPKVVCDFHGIRAGEHLKRKIEINGSYIKRIRVGEHGGAAPKLRVVLDLVPDKECLVDQTFFRKEKLYHLVFKPAD